MSFCFVAIFWLLLIIQSTKNLNVQNGIFEISSNVILNSNSVGRVAVHSEVDCALTCLRNENCLSFNIAVKSEHEALRECQMLDVDRETAREALTDSSSYHHYTMKKPPCSSNPCLNGRCLEEAGGLVYNCQCYQGFMGRDCETVKWFKVASSVSFGAMGDTPGVFTIKQTGQIITFKLVHISGYVSGDKSNAKHRSNWFINANDGSPDPRLGVVITDNAKNLVLPELPQLEDKSLYIYKITGYNSMSSELVLLNFTTPKGVVAGQTYQIWYWKDIKNFYEADCEGMATVDVYALYV